MAVYPFYTEIDSSTRRSNCGCGTRNKDGYMTTHIYQRSEGSITEPYTIKQRSSYTNGKHELITEVWHDNKIVHSHTTEY